MAGGLTEAQRGMLLSTMSDASVATMLGRSEGWVRRQRGVLADLPGVSSVHVKAAVAAKPWAPDEDPFAPVEPVVVMRPEHRETWREAGIAAVRATFASPVPRPSVGSFPVRPAPPPAWAQRAADPERGHEPPAVIPPDPALVSEKHYERQFVRSKRALGVSWFNIAKMTGRTAPYLKAQYGGGSL